MRKITSTLIAACIFFMLSMTAYAETSTTPIREITTGPQPISVETTTENGVTIIEKTFEYTPGLDPQTLAQPFELDGYSFTSREILRFAASGELSVRPASKSAVIVSDTNDISEVIEQFPDTIHYEQDGYEGMLRLDSTSLVIEPDGYETFTYPFTRTRDIPGIARNDPALVEREWDGMTLSDVSFRRGADGRYTATAVYRGMTTGRRPTSFVATVNYYGEVTQRYTRSYPLHCYF